MLTINIGTAAQPDFMDLERVVLVTLIRNPAGPSLVDIFGGGKPRRTLEGEEAARFITVFDTITNQMG
jgi:hypothetical protein